MAEDTKDTKDNGSDFIGEANGEGLSFEPPHLVGSGTILPDSTYGPPTPDPTVVRGLGGRRTSGGRLVGLSEDVEQVGPNVTEDATTKKQATSSRTTRKSE